MADGERPLLSDDDHVLLLCTVGTSPEPVVHSVRAWRPQRVVFVCTTETAETVEGVVSETALDPGRYDIVEISDPDDLGQVVVDLRAVVEEVARWQGRSGPGTHRTVVDFTGGTKVMSAAAVLVASQWSPTVLSYVSGDRTGPRGIVRPGSERVVPVEPWQVHLQRVVDEHVVLFNHHEYRAAADLVRHGRAQFSDLHARSQLQALEHLAAGFAHWDRFQHTAALKVLGIVPARASDLQTALEWHGRDLGRRVARTVAEDLLPFLERLSAAGSSPTREVILDLLANAERRIAEGRHDDAVARCYRAVEAAAQHRLAEEHGISSTGAVALERIPEPLRSEVSHDAAPDGTVALALQRAYQLLALYGDDLGRRFIDSGLEDLLPIRNQSILAHGFQPVPESAAQRMLDAVKGLIEADDDDLPRFPELRPGG